MIYNKSRYKFGVNTVKHKGKDITTSVGSEMDNLIENIESLYNFEYGRIPSEHDSRPDLTSYIFYQTVGYWWMLMQYNNITDPFEGFAAGNIIKIPKL